MTMNRLFFENIKSLTNKVKEKNYLTYLLIIILFLHAFGGSIFVLFDYKNHKPLTIFLMFISIYVPFIIFTIISLIELFIIKRKYIILTFIFNIIKFFIIIIQFFLSFCAFWNIGYKL